MHRSALVALCLALLAGPLRAGEVNVINADAAFPEGPFWADGKLYYAEYGGNRVSVWDGATNRALWTEDGCGPSAVMPFAGGMLVTCYDNGTYVKIGADGKTEQVWDKDFDRGGAGWPERRDLGRPRRRLSHRIRPLGERPDRRQGLPPHRRWRAHAGRG